MKINEGDTVIIEVEALVDTVDNKNNTVCVVTELPYVSWVSQKAIKQVIPKPFDWKDVKRGMAFKHQHGVENIYYYVAQSLEHEERVVCMLKKGNPRKDYFSYFKTSLTRAPEHDMEVEE